MDPHVKSRLTRVLDAEGLDALVASTPENLQYVTGFRSIAHAIFRGLELYGVFTRQGVGLVIPFIDAAGVAADGITVDRLACYGKFFFNYADPPGAAGARVRAITSAPAAGPGEALREVLGGLGRLGGRIGLDEAAVFPATWQRLSGQLGGATLVPAYGHFRAARMIKSAEEVRRLERAALIAEDGVAAVLAMLKPGVTEREAATVFEQEVLRKGAQPFFTVVTMGERAALADVYASERALAPGDLIRFDLGCVYQGYRSDISRTAVLGPPSDKQRRYYEAVRDGEIAAIAAMKPGVPVSQIFETAMRVTRERGMPHYERHHVGHGIGLEPYDPPTINAATQTPLEPGMVFCVETPYYEHGWGGVQVEDAVEVTVAGARRLTRSSQELAILG
ncbi:MAG TPA: Xaa-Pro peptidase family protein [Candidatus Deferrimicrobiaceae bacterium]|nr:Xaa-Pro peptidase family protein [Candidatus Deferrimicrobiaceae bacterium]